MYRVLNLKVISIFLLAFFFVGVTACSSSKDDDKKKLNYKGVAAKFNDNKEATKYTITVYANQPGEGGDRDTYEREGLIGVDVGHSFVKLERENADGTKTTITIGFYPVNEANPASPTDDGGIYDDSDEEFDVSKVYEVTEENFKKALDYIQSIETSKKKYNLNDYNCTDFAIKTANAAGANVPDTDGSWPGGGGSNPGDLGEDIR